VPCESEHSETEHDYFSESGPNDKYFLNFIILWRPYPEIKWHVVSSRKE
jgi:hypothetical protein